MKILASFKPLLCFAVVAAFSDSIQLVNAQNNTDCRHHSEPRFQIKRSLKNDTGLLDTFYAHIVNMKNNDTIKTWKRNVRYGKPIRARVSDEVFLIRVMEGDSLTDYYRYYNAKSAKFLPPKMKLDRRTRASGGSHSSYYSHHWDMCEAGDCIFKKIGEGFNGITFQGHNVKKAFPG